MMTTAGGLPMAEVDLGSHQERQQSQMSDEVCKSATAIQPRRELVRGPGCWFEQAQRRNRPQKEYVCPESHVDIAAIDRGCSYAKQMMGPRCGGGDCAGCKLDVMVPARSVLQSR